MALTACPECGGKVSTEAATCPHCGKPLRDDSSFWAVCFVAPLAAALVILGALLVGMIVVPRMEQARTNPLRRAGNEAEALASVRRIAKAQEAFQDAVVVDVNLDGVGDYGTLAELAASAEELAPAYVDQELASGTKAGYSFVVEVDYGVEGTEPGYTCVAKPMAPGASGYREYYVDESGVIRYTADGSAVGPESTPLQ